jgi:protocatechuate 3,4-dioxygenase beta subunit
MNRAIKSVFPGKMAFGLVLGIATVVARAGEAPAREKPAVTKSEVTGTINGELLDEDGKPVAGAKVVLAKSIGRDQKRQRKEASPDAAASEPESTNDKARRRPERVTTATTDDDGKFTLDAVPAGEYTVRAQLKGGGTAVARVTVTAGKAADVGMTLKPRTADKSTRGKREPTPEEQAEREQRRQDRKAAKKAAKSQA